MEKESSRLHYACDHVFAQLLGLQYVFTTEKTDFVHINYSKKTEIGGLNCIPQGILEEIGFDERHKKEIKAEKWNGIHWFYNTGGTDLRFDLFAASFFLLSRYEEYLDYFEDEHQRFTARESVLLNEELLEEPLINQWALFLKQQLLSSFPELQFNCRSFEYLSTIDIDQAWKFKHKGLKRNVAGFARDAVEFKWENVKDRWPVLLGLKRDPFYNFDWQRKWHKEHHTKLNYFILLGDYDEYDKNINPSNTAFQKCIKMLDTDTNGKVGIHPSYASHLELIEGNSNTLSVEIKRLETVLSRPTIHSRQHFLLHKFPDTYHQLLAHGIKEEHSMGYSTHAGFRAGIAAPFYYYNFTTEQSTDLKLIPFCYMDITPLYYMQLSPEKAIEHCKSIMDKVKSVGGLFVSLWHNESLSETERWKDWRVLYEEMTSYANA